MKVGSAGIALIKSFESCKLTAYQDQRGIWTIGWGHTGSDVHEGLCWTQEQADMALVHDLQVTVVGVLKALDVAISQNAFDALVSFAFNVGVEAFHNSTLLKLVNQHYTGAASAQFLVWDHTNGQENAGLLRRRQAEKALFLTPDAPAPVASA
jgi:lysozyme